MLNIFFVTDTELRPYSSGWSVKAFDQGEADFIKGSADSFLEKLSVNIYGLFFQLELLNKFSGLTFSSHFNQSGFKLDKITPLCLH